MRIPILFLYWGLWYLVFTARAILSPLLPLIERSIGINHTMAGSFFLAFYIGFTISLFSSGILSLRLGYKRTIFVGLVLMTASYAVMRFTTTYYVFAMMSALLGLSAGFYVPCAIPLITASFDEKHWGKAISFHETAAGFSIFSIPFLVVLALRVVSWPSIFLIMSVWSVIMGVLLMIFSPNPQPTEKQKGSMMGVLRRREFWIIAAFWIACSAASMGIYSILPLFLVTERGMAMDVANTVFGFSRIGGFFVMILIGFILDRFDVRKIMFFIVLLTAVCTLGIALIQIHWLLVSMLFVQATFSVVFFPAALFAISRITTLSERSVFTGAMMGISSITGAGVVPVILGAVADNWNFQAGILGTGIFVLATCFLFRFLRDM